MTVDAMFTKIMEETSSIRQEIVTVKKSFSDQLGEVSKNSNNRFQENYEAISQLHTEMDSINAPPHSTYN